MNLVLPSRIPHDALTAYVCDRLRRLTRVLAECGVDTAGGLLGGSDGYGAEHTNAVFEMHPQWWGDCTCGREEAECRWLDANPHAATCYQTDLDAIRFPFGDDGCLPMRISDAQYQALCAKHGIAWNDGFASACHCTCGRDKRHEAMGFTCKPDCKLERPNFKAGDFEVRWYKWIGRSTELHGAPATIEAIAELFDRCEAAVRASVVEVGAETPATVNTTEPKK